MQRGNATSFLRKLNKVFRFSRAPFSTAKFGKSLQSARQQLANSLKKGHVDELVDMWIDGVARDQGQDMSTFTKADLIEVLEKKTGWESFIAIIILSCL